MYNKDFSANSFLYYCFSCSRPEQKVAIPVGVLQKQVKSAEEKERELEESIRKNQEKIRQIQVLDCYFLQRWSWTVNLPTKTSIVKYFRGDLMLRK